MIDNDALSTSDLAPILDLSLAFFLGGIVSREISDLLMDARMNSTSCDDDDDLCFSFVGGPKRKLFENYFYFPASKMARRVGNETINNLFVFLEFRSSKTRYNFEFHSLRRYDS